MFIRSIVSYLCGLSKELYEQDIIVKMPSLSVKLFKRLVGFIVAFFPIVILQGMPCV
jgi:hypothetical protein